VLEGDDYELAERASHYTPFIQRNNLEIKYATTKPRVSKGLRLVNEKQD
jgi:hypothetical protein